MLVYILERRPYRSAISALSDASAVFFRDMQEAWFTSCRALILSGGVNVGGCHRGIDVNQRKLL